MKNPCHLPPDCSGCSPGTVMLINVPPTHDVMRWYKPLQGGLSDCLIVQAKCSREYSPVRRAKWLESHRPTGKSFCTGQRASQPQYSMIREMFVDGYELQSPGQVHCPCRRIRGAIFNTSPRLSAPSTMSKISLLNIRGQRHRQIAPCCMSIVQKQGAAAPWWGSQWSSGQSGSSGAPQAPPWSCHGSSATGCQCALCTGGTHHCVQGQASPDCGWRWWSGRALRQAPQESGKSISSAS